MTITLTIEELKAHDSALDKWLVARVEFSAKWLHSNSDPCIGFGAMNDYTRFQAAMKDYDSKNPMPRLMPVV